jgi:hypothetical protein
MTPQDAQFVRTVILSVFSDNFSGDPGALLKSSERSSGVKVEDLSRSNLDQFLNGVNANIPGKAGTWQSKFALGVLRKILEKHTA